MKRTTALCLCVLCFCAGAFGQAARPTPTPPPADETDVVKITTSLIQIDVTVTDKKGKVVTDLRPDEIEVYENGEKQKITNFSFISNIASTEAQPTAKSDRPTPLPPAPVRPEQVRRTIALIVDDLTLSFESIYWARRALKKFVDEQMREGDLVAIIRTGAGIGALQQFTNDKRQLYAAIEKVRWNPAGSGNIGAFAPLEARDDSQETEPQPGERTAEGIKREQDDFRESVFAAGTLGAVNYVVRGMQDLPGRKSVMLLSDGFKLFTEDAVGFRESGRVLESLRRLADMANRAAVVIYTMDARGLQYTGLTAADNTTGWSREQLQQAESDRNARIRDTQDGLRYLAQLTGGSAVLNTNDLSGGIRKILDDQSYYLVGYEPDDATFDPRTRRFNQIEIKVTRPGTRVRYRSGFFGVSDEKIARPQQTPEQRLVYALTSPFAVNQVGLRLNTLFYNTAKGGNLLRSLLHIRGQDLTFTDLPDGSKQATFDIIAFSFGDNGLVVDQAGKSYELTIKKEMYEHVRKNGFVYNFYFAVKKPGAYQLRVALRDRNGDKIGSANQFVEVPNLKKNRLVLSGVMLENISFAEYERRNAATPDSEKKSDPLTDTSLRQFERGTVLNYGFTIYNARAAGGTANLSYQTRVFQDGKLKFESPVQPVRAVPSSEPGTIGFSAALSLGSAMGPGDYVLQVVIIDNLAKAKQNTAVQFVPFEIIE